MSDLNISLSASQLRVHDADKLSPQQANSHATVDKPVSTEVNTEKERKASSNEEVTAVVQEMNAFVQNMQRNLSFHVDEQLGEPIISVTDLETDEVIRQIPSEELVVLRKKMDDLTGILFDTKV